MSSEEDCLILLNLLYKLSDLTFCAKNLLMTQEKPLGWSRVRGHRTSAAWVLQHEPPCHRNEDACGRFSITRAL